MAAGAVNVAVGTGVASADGSWLFDEAKVGPVRAGSTTAAARAAGAAQAPIVTVYAPPLRTNSHRHPLASVSGLGPWQHTVIHRKVAANQVCPLGCVLNGQLLTLEAHIRVVFAVVDSHCAFVAMGSDESGVVRFWPLTALAEAREVLHVKHCEANAVTETRQSKIGR